MFVNMEVDDIYIYICVVMYLERRLKISVFVVNLIGCQPFLLY